MSEFDDQMNLAGVWKNFRQDFEDVGMDAHHIEFARRGFYSGANALYRVQLNIFHAHDRKAAKILLAAIVRELDAIRAEVRASQ